MQQSSKCMITFIERLQSVHDSQEVEDWEGFFQEIAEFRKLIYRPLEQ